MLSIQAAVAAAATSRLRYSGFRSFQVSATRALKTPFEFYPEGTYKNQKRTRKALKKQVAESLENDPMIAEYERAYKSRVIRIS